jgi:hypothetical protein
MSEETKTVAELAAETKAAFDKKHDEVKAIAEEGEGPRSRRAFRWPKRPRKSPTRR